MSTSERERELQHLILPSVSSDQINDVSFKCHFVERNPSEIKPNQLYETSSLK